MAADSASTAGTHAAGVPAPQAAPPERKVFVPDVPAGEPVPDWIVSLAIDQGIRVLTHNNPRGVEPEGFTEDLVFVSSKIAQAALRIKRDASGGTSVPFSP